VDQRHLPGAECERTQRKPCDQQEFSEGGAAVAGRTTASSPFKGEVRRGMGLVGCEFGCAVCCLRDDPIPTPALPLKGREWCVLPLKGREWFVLPLKGRERFVLPLKGRQWFVLPFT
jgi:hypothetical protein